MVRIITSILAFSAMFAIVDSHGSWLHAQDGLAAQVDAGASSSSTGETSKDTEEAAPNNAETSFGEAFFRNPLNLVLLVFVGLYVLLLFLPKPGKREQKALRERLANLKKNDRVVLNSGIHGVVANINAEAGTVTLRVDESSNARITVDRTAIRSVEA
ncbi:preprotein translocase subunit YajC [Pirellulaceae bacterium SH449]